MFWVQENIIIATAAAAYCSCTWAGDIFTIAYTREKKKALDFRLINWLIRILKWKNK